MFGLYRKISNLHFAVLISLSLGSPRQGLGLRPCGGRDGGERSPLTPVWPGFDSRTRRHMWVEFVVGSLLCSERFFSWYSGFPLSLKNQHCQIPIRSWNGQAFQTSSCETNYIYFFKDFPVINVR